MFSAAFWWGGCSTPVVNQTVTFNETDYQPYEATGTAVVRGHAFVRSDTGLKHGAAGIQVVLVPLTPYTEERAHIMESGKEPGPIDPRLEKYTHTTVGDWGGAYTFDHLPAGKYLVYCKVNWEAQVVNTMRRDANGSVYAVGRTQLADGEHKDLVVTNVRSR